MATGRKSRHNACLTTDTDSPSTAWISPRWKPSLLGAVSGSCEKVTGNAAGLLAIAISRGRAEANSGSTAHHDRPATSADHRDGEPVIHCAFSAGCGGGGSVCVGRPPVPTAGVLLGCDYRPRHRANDSGGVTAHFSTVVRR